MGQGMRGLVYPSVWCCFGHEQVCGSERVLSVDTQSNVSRAHVLNRSPQYMGLTHGLYRRLKLGPTMCVLGAGGAVWAVVDVVIVWAV